MVITDPSTRITLVLHRSPDDPTADGAIDVTPQLAELLRTGLDHPDDAPHGFETVMSQALEPSAELGHFEIEGDLPLVLLTPIPTTGTPARVLDAREVESALTAAVRYALREAQSPSGDPGLDLDA